MQKNLIIAAIVLFVSGIVVGVNGVFDSILMAIGAALFLVAYRHNRRAWTTLAPKESIKRPLTKTIIFVAISVVAVYCSTGRGFTGDIATGFGGTALIVGAYLIYTNFGPKKSTGAK